MPADAFSARATTSAACLASIAAANPATGHTSGRRPAFTVIAATRWPAKIAVRGAAAIDTTAVTHSAASVRGRLKRNNASRRLRSS
ncbi:hypothetical protein [Nonomuraea rubra]|uniref:Uncharacterized protein n=1 Tax=Nonomuraea rubra TaxID=46180 RepID=A0A7X0U4M3_9ACTN|nr:hypothetical protein [Nonomuraea rubra]MBB6555137.1 hypothetical protein [Nonomuraea rubra]